MNEADRLKIFISYARRDGAAFADELMNGLELGGFDAFLDREDIAVGEAWEQRLEALIAAADTILFVVTPGSVASERCAWEVDKALSLGKRIIPVMAEKVAADQLPAALSEINYIDFSAQSSFTRSLKLLASALGTDVEWLREHTRLADLARRWDTRGRPKTLLLRGPELDAAQTWMNAAQRTLAPTELHIEFIGASADHQSHELEAERQRLSQVAVEQGAKEEALRKLSRRTTLGLGASGALTLAAAGLAYWGVNAETRFQEERRRTEEALLNSTLAAIEKEAARRDLAGQLTAFGAAPGTAAHDGEGDNSPFTLAVLSALQNENNSLLWAVLHGQSDVLEATKGQQRPEISTSMNGEIYLKRPSPTRKVLALCVSCDAYLDVTLKNVGNDAARWAEFLDSCGYEVVTLTNPTRLSLRTALADLAARMRREDTQKVTIEPAAIVGPLVPPGREEPPIEDSLILFFYAGGGFQIGGNNYMIVADTDFAAFPDFNAIAATSISLEEVAPALTKVSQATALILDTGFYKTSER